MRPWQMRSTPHKRRMVSLRCLLSARTNPECAQCNNHYPIIPNFSFELLRSKSKTARYLSEFPHPLHSLHSSRLGKMSFPLVLCILSQAFARAFLRFSRLSIRITQKSPSCCLSIFLALSLFQAPSKKINSPNSCSRLTLKLKRSKSKLLFLLRILK